MKGETTMHGLMLREGTPEEAGMDPARVERLRELLAGWVACGDTPSAVACVARRGVIVLHEAYGVLHHGDTTPTLRRDSIFPISSCSKSLTAAAIMCLVDDGLIGLNRSFVDYVPELDRLEVEGLTSATVADLLCHTSGIDDPTATHFIGNTRGWTTEVPLPPPGRHPIINKIIHLMAGMPLGRPPGTAMLYSSFGYDLLGDIVRRVSGQPLWRFAQTRLFEPLGMHDSAYVLPPEARQRRVLRTPGVPGTAALSPWRPSIDSAETDALDSGASGASSTARDLAVFAQMLLNGGTYGDRRVVSRASVIAMTRPQVDTNIAWLMASVDPVTSERKDYKPNRGGYGFGLAVLAEGDRYRLNGSLASVSAFGHGGFGGTHFWADPDQDLAGAYFSVSPRMDRNTYFTNFDLFMNAVHAAIID
jgi:serine-type D-Ala-D-Ala carboxypeptidase